MSLGYLAMVLHAHLPYVRHPEYEDFLEEDWFYEAITETYIPLIHVLEGFQRDGVNCRLTMSLTPPLCEMFADELLQSRYLRHIELLIELAEKEIHRTRFMPEFHETAKMYHRRFHACRSTFADRYGRNLIGAFRQFQETGKLEIITCGATHGFQPLLAVNKWAARAQVMVARDNYIKHFGRGPRGIWNGECGYYPGLDEHIREAGIRFFFVDTHGILYADKRPRYGIFAPLYCPTGVAAFGRDIESSKSVWSAEEGYPGNPDYREFYRDVGFDLDFDYIKPYVHESGLRVNTGIKYFRITETGLAHKEPYNEGWAMERAAEHAGNFMFNREQQIRHVAGLIDRPPIVVSPYDAELFGHWWYEGPNFLDFLFRKIHFDQDTIEPITPMEYLERHPVNQAATPSFSSWGHKGYAEVWLEGSNDWIYRHLHAAADRMVELANRFPDERDNLKVRALTQAARELLLAQSSDWAFIMKTNTMVPYAERRTREHLLWFNDLYEMLMRGEIDESRLRTFEWRDSIFPELDYRHFAPRE
jgi:1,4-alpha-glucan branching enzyme